MKQQIKKKDYLEKLEEKLVKLEPKLQLLVFVLSRRPALRGQRTTQTNQMLNSISASIGLLRTKVLTTQLNQTNKYTKKDLEAAYKEIQEEMEEAFSHLECAA